MLRESYAHDPNGRFAGFRFASQCRPCCGGRKDKQEAFPLERSRSLVRWPHALHRCTIAPGAAIRLRRTKSPREHRDQRDNSGLRLNMYALESFETMHLVRSTLSSVRIADAGLRTERMISSNEWVKVVLHASSQPSGRRQVHFNTCGACSASAGL